ncbi:YceI family protein [Alteromonas flava]|uniref:YceI family protein n=1 Tax=Alteromonas flava TaxID=2048003 RepID=UPI000C28F2DA|nr:YceI family protein [Alteromonas flava]
MRFLSLGLLFLSTSVFANWQLDNDASALHFISTKNEHIAEVHTFDRLSGELSKDGSLTISIDLTSVNTMIPVRNTRMQEMLFNVSEYAQASFSTQLPAEVMSMAVGESKQMTQSGTLSLHGETAEVSFVVNVQRLNNTTISAHTVKPSLVNASQFGLTAGVDALRKIAGLNSISYAVPVTFSVTLKQSQ